MSLVSSRNQHKDNVCDVAIQYLKVLADISSTHASIPTSAALSPPLKGTGGSCSLARSVLFPNKGFSVCQVLSPIFDYRAYPYPWHAYQRGQQLFSKIWTKSPDPSELRKFNKMFYLLVSLRVLL